MSDSSIDLAGLARHLRPSRRPDVAGGLLLAAELIIQSVNREVWLSLRDAAVALYPEAGDELLDELLTFPDGEHVNEDDLVCQTCDGEPQQTIVELRCRIEELTRQLPAGGMHVC
jgi:hypothetical protein